MSDEVSIFEGQGFKVRLIRDEEGNIWFVAKDIVQDLEYSEASIRQLHNLLAVVPTIWKGHKRIMTLGGEQEMLCLTEQGLYFFLGRSDKKKALPYQIWVAGEVVPNIMHTGMYLTPKAKEDLIADPDLIIQLATEVKEQRARNAELEAQNKALEARTGQLESHSQKLEAKIEADKDKVSFAEVVEDCEDAILIRTFAKILYKRGFVTMGEQRLYQWLRNHKILMTGGKNHNMPYQQYLDRGWFRIKEHIVNVNGQDVIRTTTMVTGKGQRGVFKLLESLKAYKIENRLPLVY